MKATGNRVTVRKVLRNVKTTGGIDIPETQRAIPDQGVVTSIGRGYVNDDGDLVPITDIKIGDHILFEKRSGQIIKHSGVEVRTIPYDMICGVLLTSDKPLVQCPECKGNGVVEAIPMEKA